MYIPLGRRAAKHNNNNNNFSNFTHIHIPTSAEQPQNTSTTKTIIANPHLSRGATKHNSKNEDRNFTQLHIPHLSRGVTRPSDMAGHLDVAISPDWEEMSFGCVLKFCFLFRSPSQKHDRGDHYI